MIGHIRALVVLPMYGGSLPVGRYCAAALRGLGHTVEVFEAPGFHSAFTALKDLKVTSERLGSLENSFLQVVSQAVLAKVETFEPDLVLCLAQAPMTQNALRRLNRDNVATAMWFVEDWRVFSYWRAFAPLYDVFAVIQQEPFLSELAGAGVEHALYLPMAAHPAMHRPLSLSPSETHRFGSDVSFMGAGYPNRRIAFRRLTGFDFKIWGTEWEGETLLARYVQAQGRRVSPEDSVRIYNASKVNINLHSSVQARELVPKGDFVNPRTFELAACGAFQLVDRRALLPELFTLDGPNRELVCFASMEELLDMIPTWLNAASEREAMAGRARQRALREHTYARRMERLLEFIASTRPGWPQPRSGPGPLDALCPALKQDVAGLLETLGLPRDAAFKDVAWALRGRQGKLTDLETALLFLDEWQKQYGREKS